MFAEINGTRLAYEEFGQGNALSLLLVHGFPLDGRMWQKQVEMLAGVAHVVVPDLRGHGRSDAPPGPYTMEQHADDLAALLDHLAIGRAVVAGLSMGGYVTLAFWRRHRERSRALVLLDTRAEPDSDVARLNREQSICKVENEGVAAFAEEMLPRVLAASSVATPEIADTVRGLMVSQPAHGVIGALGGLRDRMDSRATLATIAAPALVLVGELDTLTPPADMQALAATLPDGRFVVIPRAGHLSPLENPTAVNDELLRFLRELA